MLKTVRGILNKLTPSKFEALLARIQALDIDSEDRLAGVIKLFFEKVFIGLSFKRLNILCKFFMASPFRLLMNRFSRLCMQKCVKLCQQKK
jgi:hypothetical protein